MEWLEEFAENLEDADVQVPAHISHDLEAQCFNSLPKRSKLRSMLANQKEKGSLQEDAPAKLHFVQKSSVT